MLKNVKKYGLGAIIIICICLFIINCSNNYSCKIIKYNIVSDKEAYITYEATNNTNKEVTLRVYSSIEKNGEVIAQKLTYIIVSAKSKSEMTITLTTERNVSFYGSKAKIKIEKSTL